MTYSAPVFVRARFMNRNTGEIKEQTVFMGDFPIMTEKGTFIVNGTERVVGQPARAQPRRDLRARRALPPPQPHQAPARQGHDPPLPRRVDGVRRRAEARARTSPPAPASPASAASASSRCCAPSATTRRTPPASSTASSPTSTSSQGQWDKERDVAPDPGRGARRDLQAGPPRRAAHRRVGAGLLPQRLLREPPLRPQPGRALQAQPQARRRGRPPRRAVRRSATSQLDLPDENQNVLSRCEVLAADHATCSTSSSRSPATASTTRTTSPTGASARSAS